MGGPQSKNWRYPTRVPSNWGDRFVLLEFFHCTVFELQSQVSDLRINSSEDSSAFTIKFMVRDVLDAHCTIFLMMVLLPLSTCSIAPTFSTESENQLLTDGAALDMQS